MLRLDAMPGNPLTDPNWAPNLADTIERVVSVRPRQDDATRPSRSCAGSCSGSSIAVSAASSRSCCMILATGCCSGCAHRRRLRPRRRRLDLLLRPRRDLRVGGMICMRKRHRQDARLSGRRPAAPHVIIIGSGPAGLTAAIYAARANLAPARDRGRAVEHQRSARRPADAHHRGRELPRLPRRHHGPRADDQLPRAGAALRRRVPHREGDRDRLQRTPVQGVGPRRSVYEADAVIVSTGAQSLMLGLEAESQLLGHGLSTCATCDGFFFRGQEIAVVGGGDSRRRGGDVPHEVRVEGDPDPPSRRAARVEDHAGPRAVEPEDRDACGTPSSTTWSATEGSRVPSCATCTRATRSTLPVTGLFVAIGHRPNTDLFKGVLDMEDNGYLVTAPGSTLHEHRRASSPAATCRTTPTARRSRPPAPAAWRRSTAERGSRPTHRG